ncbi:phosphoprotein phosphatase [Histomonas meleagridis]|uniref:phosphoprotein phosphatase n=1 Tax=Histomonas meleagridis TaxID=135588 RepID=UPI003559E208|nr:phosphoprotein phosphatase [Histomonas meleagridis]KAH0805232.1 phosphoprotein phosphatase [Histomonas meleagridis]
MKLNRYIHRNTSALAIPKRALSSNVFKKMSFHTARTPTLDPIDSDDSKSESEPFDEPFDEVGIPNKLMTVVQFKQKHHDNIQFPILPLLTVPFNKNECSLLKKKIELCSTLCNFADDEADHEAKTIKADTLKELMNIFASPTMIRLVSTKIINKFFEMVYTNITRPIPPTHPKYLFQNEEPQMVDISWSHLSIIYDLLSKYQSIRPTDPHFDKKFIATIFPLLHAPDLNERDYISTMIENYLDTHNEDEQYILSKMLFCIFQYLDNKCYPFCITPILKIFIHLIKSQQPINPNYIKIYNGVVVHLHSSQHLTTFYPLLTEIIDLLSNDNPSICKSIFENTIKYWPKSKPSKQILFVNLINFIVERVTPTDFPSIINPLFSLYAKVATTKYSKVAEASMQIWNDIYILPKIIDNAAAIYPIVYSAYTKTMNEHWNPKTRNAAHNALKKMHENDQFVYENISQTMIKVNEQDLANATAIHKSWAAIARKAAKVDSSVNLAKLLGDIQINFNLDRSSDMYQVSVGKQKKKSNVPKKVTMPLFKANRNSQIVTPFHWKM